MEEADQGLTSYLLGTRAASSMAKRLPVMTAVSLHSIACATATMTKAFSCTPLTSVELNKDDLERDPLEGRKASSAPSNPRQREAGLVPYLNSTRPILVRYERLISRR
jgi:hypothetical protein